MHLASIANLLILIGLIAVMLSTTGARNAAVALVIVSSNFAGTPAVTAVIAYALVSILGTLLCAFLFAAVPATSAAK